MDTLTSYQKRKQNIAYYKQCAWELQEIALEMARDMAKKNIDFPLLMGPAMSGDMFITHIMDSFGNGFIEQLKDEYWENK